MPLQHGADGLKLCVTEIWLRGYCNLWLCDFRVNVFDPSKFTPKSAIFQLAIFALVTPLQNVLEYWTYVGLETWNSLHSLEY